jgi:hypothetical protein
MLHRPFAVIALVLSCVGLASCGPAVDLHSLKVVDVVSGYYDNGFKDAKTYLVPSVTFRLENTGPVDIQGLELTVAFWQDGKDGEWDSSLIQRIGDDKIPAGAKSDPVTVHCTVGYTLEGMRADFFTNSLYRDVTVKIFARRSGTIVPIGEVKLDRQILPHVSAPGRP